MSNKMLIDATHPEETRVVVLRGNRVEEFDFESANRKQLRGNIYLAKVTRVEPSLQAAFVDYGGNRHGFLAFSEIHPDYYQIPIADRQALLEDERRAQRDEEDENARGERRSRRGRHSRRGAQRNRNADVVRSETIEAAQEAEVAPAGREEAADPFEQASIAREAETIFEGEATSGGPKPDALASATVGDDQTTQPPSTGPAGEPLTETAAAPEGALPTAEGIREDAGTLAESVPAAAAPAVEVGESTRATAEDAPSPSNETPALSQTDDQAPVVPGDPEDRSPADGEIPSDEEEDEDADVDEVEEEEAVESVGGDAIEEVMERAPRYRRHYKIQEVIKRRQVMLVQVVKEERGTKGAALTTYLSLAGRYCVLMPNTARGGGISRKVTNAEDRKHMKEIAEELEVPEGMGVILRTAGASRTKIEIKRDFEYLLRLWETVRDLTLKSTAPTLVYEEGSLIKRAIRDLYHKDIEEIVVEGEQAYREAKDFMRMLMPTHMKNVVLYNDTQPIFTRYGIEPQLDAMFQPTVQLKSGGYVVINQTEALVAIDVNSGRATREHSIEETATKTNMEAAVEIARQLRLRDLAGLIVIDFIDMDEGRNNRAVERKLKEALKSDRARIQVGRISHFGLLEMSRQRIRSSVLESSTETCPHCGGTGHVRAVGSVALQLVRAVEETLLKGATHNLIVRSRSDVAIYVLNHKRAHLRMLEERFRISIAVNVDPTLAGHPAFAIDRGEQVMSAEQAKAIASSIRPDTIAPYEPAEEETEDLAEDVLDSLEAEGGDAALESPEQQERTARRRRRRGRRGRGRDGDARETAPREDEAEIAESNEPAELGDAEALEEGEAEDQAEEEAAHANGNGERRRRRRGRRGGRRNRRDSEGEEHELAGSVSQRAQENGPAPDFEPAADVASQPAADTSQRTPIERPAADREAPTPAAPAQAAKPEPEQPPRRRSTVREAPPIYSGNDTVMPMPAPVAPPTQIVSEPPAEQSQPAAEKPRRFGWWSRRA